MDVIIVVDMEVGLLSRSLPRRSALSKTTLGGDGFALIHIERAENVLGRQSVDVIIFIH